MKRRQNIIVFIGIMTILLLSACGPQGIQNGYNSDLEEFTFTDQNHKEFSKSDLKGKVWIADFVFTNCTSVCLPMTSNLSDFQGMLKDNGISDVDIVSFSVDPELDTPAALKEYAERFNADLPSWHFLTGYTQQEIEEFAKKNFKTIVQKPANTDQVIHGTKFYLVNKEGQIVKDYSGVSDVPFEEMMNDIKILQK
ncbi:SCO family protein [Peribacillus loiseleuriae]|uniref:Photosynthetic protein synthase I n=1 Tax=Peribacillus loiseleuriae TaxID=1679170 RepID=A0A0K9GW74_9BACI|nr:SCO family protein [Peribacillus loiseleuriae]KMY50487.1 photosynthetic protein synthase I [Peribacillus loiseleuriae]